MRGISPARRNASHLPEDVFGYLEAADDAADAVALYLTLRQGRGDDRARGLPCGGTADAGRNQNQAGQRRCAPDEAFPLYPSEGLIVHANHWVGQVALTKLRDLSPLWDMYKDGIDISTIQWAEH